MILSATLLIGCATESFSFDCPSIKEYTAEEQLAIAKVVKEADPKVQQLLLDYYKLREKVRACTNTEKKTQ